MSIQQYRFVLSILTEGSHAVVPGEFSRQLRTEIEKFQQRITSWTQGPSIVGFGIGQKVTGSKKQDELSIKVYVNKKQEPLNPKRRIPTEVPLPPIPGYPGPFSIDVVQIGNVIPNGNKPRSVSPGSSIGTNQMNGTLGCYVTPKDDVLQTWLLSNSHVIAGWGNSFFKGDGKIYAPGSEQSEKNVVAILASWIPYIFSDDPTNFANLVDAAAGLIAPNITADPSIPGIGIPNGVRAPERDTLVTMLGASSPIPAYGEIIDVDFKTAVYFPNGVGTEGRVGFRKQILCQTLVPGIDPVPFSNPGDSGALVVDSEAYAVGLNWAGSDGGCKDSEGDGEILLFGVSNNIAYVLEELNVNLITA